MDNSPIFWDIIGPLSLVVFCATILWSIYGFRKKSALILLMSGIIEIPICFIFAWSIGEYLTIVPIIQFIAAFYTLRKARSST